VTALFKPKGEKAEWVMIFEALLDDADFGTIVTYEQLDELLGRSFEDNRAPMYRARSELGERRKRWLEAVPRVGYRVIDANEHVRVAGQHKRKARHQMTTMVKVSQVTDVSKLTPTELAEFDTQSKVNWLLYSALVHHERRITRIEELLRDKGETL
jgi:hypothetical protein